MTMAWWIGLMHHTDPKKYPKQPALVWDKNAGDHTVDQLKLLVMAWADNGDEIRKAESQARH